MKYIGNILTSSKLDISPFFNLTDDLNLIDSSIPTLIVGWDEMKKNFPEQNILNKKITENITWTFSKRERRYQYENDIQKFIINTIDNVNDKCNYHFFNYIIASNERKGNFLNYIKENTCSVYYNSNFIYIYIIKDSITIGISLKDLSYIGINVNDFISSINLNKNNIICNNINDIGNKSLFLIKDNIKIIPYLNYLKNSDIYDK